MQFKELTLAAWHQSASLVHDSLNKLNYNLVLFPEILC